MTTKEIIMSEGQPKETQAQKRKRLHDEEMARQAVELDDLAQRTREADQERQRRMKEQRQ